MKSVPTPVPHRRWQPTPLPPTYWGGGPWTAPCLDDDLLASRTLWASRQPLQGARAGRACGVLAALDGAGDPGKFLRGFRGCVNSRGPCRARSAREGGMGTDQALPGRRFCVLLPTERGRGSSEEVPRPHGALGGGYRERRPW